MADTTKIAHLSRIAITEEEHDAVQSKFSDVLSAFDVLAKIDCKPHAEFVKASTREDLRDDIRKDSLGQEQALALAPESFNGHFRVPSVL